VTTQSDAASQAAAEQNAIVTDQTLQTASVTLKPGFNNLFVPRDEVGWDVKPFKDKGLVVYDFNPDGSKTWQLSSKDQIPSLKPGIGYYIYNPTNQDISVIVSTAGTNDIRTLRAGWNLLANSTSLYAKLSDLIYQIPKPDQPTCSKASCMMQTSLLEYFNKTVTQNLAYKNLFMIKDASATTADKAFDTIEVTPDNVNNLTFAPGDVFWMYQWK
jgi:hypothetical protein